MAGPEAELIQPAPSIHKPCLHGNTEFNETLSALLRQPPLLELALGFLSRLDGEVEDDEL